MQVDNNGSSPVFIQGSKESQNQKDTPSTTQQNKPQHSQQTGQTDTVTFSQTAAQLQYVEQHIHSAPIVDTQRIQQVKSAIESGSYDPDPTQVASKMLDFESILNSSRRVK